MVDHSLQAPAVVLVVDARDQIVDASPTATSWFGAPADGDVHQLISAGQFRAALARARTRETPLEVHFEHLRDQGPCQVRFEPVSKLMLVTFCPRGVDQWRSLLDSLANEPDLIKALQAVAAFGRSRLSGIDFTLSLLDDEGGLRLVAGERGPAAPTPALDERRTPLSALGDELGVKVCWSWPLSDSTGRSRGMLEAFSPSPRLPSGAETEQLHLLALLASMLVSKNAQEHELRDAVERFELVLGTTHHVIYDFDLVSNRLLWHARTGDAFGHWAATRDIAWWRETIHPEDRHRVERALRTTMEGGENTWSESYRFRRASGGWAWVNDAGRIRRDEGGKALRLVGVMQDVTEQRELRSRLALTERLASVGTLAAGVAHEINNPLAWITSNVNFALEEFEQIKRNPRDTTEFIEDMVDALEDARAGADRVSIIVRDLKTFSRAQDERLGAIDVRKVLESAITMAAIEIRHRAKLVREQHDVPPVEGNEGRLSQVFLNLLLNAAQSLPENDASRHEIRVVTGVDASGRVCVEVRDTGGGISPDVLPRIFDPFFTTRPVGRGTGLGLSICHTIVSSMGGSIEVDSRLGVGSTFRVLLPAKTSARPKPTPMSSAAASAVRGEVMVIDDEPSIIASIERVLISQHHVIGFTSARDALAAILINKTAPDVILCDLMMPELSGPEFFTRLLAKNPLMAARVVFMTGGAFGAAAQEFLDTVNPPLIDKPFKPDDLRRAVAERLKANPKPVATSSILSD